MQWKTLLKNRHNIEWRLERLLKRKKKPQTRCGKRKRKIPAGRESPSPFICHFQSDSVNILEIPIRSLISASSTAHTGRSRLDLPPHPQAPAPPLRNPLHSLSSTLRACSQSTSTATQQNRLYAGRDRNRTALHPSAIFRLAAILPSLLFLGKSGFPFGLRGQMEKINWRRVVGA